MHVVVVESPAKAKTVGRYLGSDYRVFANSGHVSDLPAKDGSVRPDDGFAMPYETGPLQAVGLAAHRGGLCRGRGARHHRLHLRPAALLQGPDGGRDEGLRRDSGRTERRSAAAEGDGASADGRQQLFQSTALSSVAATWSTVESSRWRPTIMKPMGRSSETPHGTEIAG